MAGRHRSSRHLTGLTIVAAGVVLVLTAGVAWGGYRLLSSPASCVEKVTLRVAAAPEIAPAVQEQANQWVTTQGGCVAVTVIAADPGDVAAAVASPRGVTLNGPGRASGGTIVPDVWVPDSSTWIRRLWAVGDDLVPAAAPSIAQSPTVLAVPQPVAGTLGWPETKLTWAALLQRVTSGRGVKVGIVEPGRDAAGLNALLTLQSVAATLGPNAQEASVAALRALAVNRSPLRAEVLARFPRDTDPATLASSLSAAPLPEQAVIAYNATKPAVPLAAVFIEPAPAALDYPYAIMPGARGELGDAAIGLRSALTGAPFKDRLAKQGLRAADGSVGATFTIGPGAPNGPTEPGPATDPAAIEQILTNWSTITQAGRILAVIDVSGSMLRPVPTAGGVSREEVTVKAAASGLSLFDDQWAVGLWVFSTNLDGATPYRQLVPIAPLASQRQSLTAALGTIVAIPQGDTALFETVIAAYQAVQTNWDGSKVNSVVLMTDGINDNPGGITLEQTIGRLQQLVDPKRPVQLIVLGIGTDVAKGDMEQLVKVTGGGVFIATDPANIGSIFLKAIALRPAAPAGG